MNLAATVGACADTSCVGSRYVSISANPAIQAAGVCTPLELNTYLNDVTSGPFTSGGPLATMLAAAGLTFVSFSMTYAEATAFFATFTAKTNGRANGLVLGQMLRQYNTYLSANEDANADATAALIFSTFGATFGTLVASVATADGASMPVCSSTPPAGPACPALALAYATYLTSYLPEKFFVGCSLLGCAGTECMKDDGTSTRNGGLFVRHTVREMLHGWDDPIFAAVPADAFPPGTPSSYEGLFGKGSSQDRTLDDLRADIAEGTRSMKDFAVERKSGADNVEDTDVWIARKGVTSSVAGEPSYTGWGNSGRPGEPFNVTGLRSIRQALPQTKVNSALAMVGNYEAKPNFGPVRDVFVTEVSRTLSMTCGAAGSLPDSVNDCAFHDVKGIKTLKYVIDPRLYGTTLDGVPSSSCRGTASARHASFAPVTSSSGPSCDWLMRHEGVLNLEVARKVPAAASLGYFGHAQSGIREAVSITEVGSSDQIYFDEAKDGVSVFYEPITGAAIKGREYFQSNFYVEATLLDSLRYENLFTADTDNENSFVWPCAQLLIEPIAPARASRVHHCCSARLHRCVRPTRPGNTRRRRQHPQERLPNRVHHWGSAPHLGLCVVRHVPHYRDRLCPDDDAWPQEESSRCFIGAEDHTGVSIEHAWEWNHIDACANGQIAAKCGRKNCAGQELQRGRRGRRKTRL